MKQGIPGSRALRVACACALALGIAPAAAWGAADGEQPASDVDALQEIVEDIPDGGETAALSEKNELQPCDNADSIPSNEQEPSENSTNPEDAGKNAVESGSSESIFKDSNFKLRAQPLSVHVKDEGQAEEQTTTLDDVKLNLDTTDVDAHVYRCAFSNTLHPKKDWGIPYSLSIPEGANEDDYQIICDDQDVHVGVSSDIEKGNSLVIFTSAEETRSATIKVVSYNDNMDKIEHDSVEITITTTIHEEPLTFTANENCTILAEWGQYQVYDITGIENEGSIFSINEAGVTCAFFDGPWDVIKSVQSSNPSVLSVNTDNYSSTVSVKSPGTALITLTLADDREFTNLVTVETFEDKIERELKFTEDETDMNLFEPISAEKFEDKFVSTGSLSNEESNFFIESSDEEVLRYESNADGPNNLAVLKPGTVTLTLYYPIWTDDGPLVTDTMTVNVVLDQTPLATAAPESNVEAGLIVSNDATNSLVRSNDLSLKATVGGLDDLTAENRERLEIYTNGGNPIIVPIDLSLVDQSGATFNGYSDQADYKFLLKLKVEGDIAKADPASLSVVYLGSDELEPVVSWSEDGHLFILTTHFSPYAIVGQAKSAVGDDTGSNGNGSQGGGSGSNGSSGDNMTNVADKGASNGSGASDESGSDKGSSNANGKGSAAKGSTSLAQTGDALLALAISLVLGAVAAAGALMLAQRRMSRW